VLVDSDRPNRLIRYPIYYDDGVALSASEVPIRRRLRSVGLSVRPVKRWLIVGIIYVRMYVGIRYHIPV
jgi:hypothetical protein